MKQNPGGHKLKDDSEMGTAIDTRLIEEECLWQQGIENIVRRRDELSGFAARRAMWESK
jgi:hypothetical protein